MAAAQLHPVDGISRPTRRGRSVGGLPRSGPICLTITPTQRKKWLGYKNRPVTLKQYYAARSLLSLGDGKPLPVVARALRCPEAQVEKWVIGFEQAGISESEKTFAKI